MHTEVVAIGASAGGVRALERLLARLDADLPTSVLVALHLARRGPSVLAEVLDRSTDLQVRWASDGARLEHGLVLVAPPDHHLQVVDDHVSVTRGPRENGLRPSVDVLFRSVAHLYGTRALGIVLSGNLDDGAAGFAVLENEGARLAVQDPADAEYPGMPRAALEQVRPDVVGSLGDIAAFVTASVRDGASGSRRRPVPADPREHQYAAMTCPTCDGALQESARGSQDVHPTYRCLIGHRWSIESLAAAKDDAVEYALLLAMRLLEERANLSRRLATRAETMNREGAREAFRTTARDMEVAAEVVRDLLDQTALAVTARELSGDGPEDAVDPMDSALATVDHDGDERVPTSGSSGP